MTHDEAMAIVRELSKNEPIARTGRGDWCVLCDAEISFTSADTDHEHKTDCLWLRARRLELGEP